MCKHLKTVALVGTLAALLLPPPGGGGATEQA